MSVELEPSELGFRRPFDHEVAEILKLTNVTGSSVAFKVKTTAPKQYCVRPNSGVVQPKSQVEVQVLLQAMKEDPPLDTKCRDKFLVQSVEIDDTKDLNLTTLWQHVEKNAKGTIQERKIRVNFLPPAGASPFVAGASTNGETSHDGPPPAYNSPSPQFGSPAAAAAVVDGKNSTTTSRDAISSAGVATGAVGAGAVAAGAAFGTPSHSNSEDLKGQLAAAREQIASLTKQLQDPQVRQRKVQDSTQEKGQTTLVQRSHEAAGVPLQITAVLCLLSFLIAYLFF